MSAPAKSQYLTLPNIFYATSALLCLAMMVMSHDFGTSNDEYFNIPYANYSLDYFATFGKNDTVLLETDKLDKSMKNYAVVTELPGHIVSRVTGWDLPMTRHVFNALISFFYIFFGALIVQRITKRWEGAFVGMALLVVLPRIFGEAMNNPKDPPYCATTLFSLYTFVVFLDNLPKPSWRHIVLLGLGIAASLWIRIAGLMTDFLFACFLAWELFLIYRKKEEIDFKDLGIKLLAAFGGGYLLGILFWPAMITNPISQPFVALEFLRNLPVTVRNLFEGHYLQSTEIPWYYLPKYFWISNPEITNIGIILGIIALPWMAKKYNIRRMLMVLVFGLFPLFLIIYSKTGLLTGWRHGYFIYTSLVVFAGIFYTYLIFEVIQKKVMRWVAIAVFALSLMPAVVFMVRNYPLFYIYFNSTFGGVSKGLGYYELDYYGHTMKPATEWYIANVPNYTQYKLVSNMGFHLNLIFDRVLGKGKYSAPYVRYRERYDTDWDYGIFSQAFVDADYLKNGYFPPKGTINTIDVDGVPVACIIKREDKNDYYGKVALDSNQFPKAVEYLTKALQYDPNNEMAWTNLGVAYLNLNKPREAITALQKALTIYPESMNAKNFITYAYLQSGEVSYAINNLNELIQENPMYPEPYKMLAQIYQQQGNATMAQQYMSIYSQITGGRP